MEVIETLRHALGEATGVVALTGAGVSAESGIPTFRGKDGLWRNFPVEELATPEAFARDPQRVWEWYDWRRGIIHQAQPNAGHRSLAELGRRRKGELTLVTQNVDGLHDRAGSENVVKLHGDIWRVRCPDCGLDERNEQVPLDPLPPRCRCGGILRPAVVWFGEPLPEDEWERAFEVSCRARLFLLVGTSATVYPAAALAQVARAGGARLAVINPDPTPFDRVAEWVLPGRSGDILPRLL